MGISCKSFLQVHAGIQRPVATMALVALDADVRRRPLDVEDSLASVTPGAVSGFSRSFKTIYPVVLINRLGRK